MAWKRTGACLMLLMTGCAQGQNGAGLWEQGTWTPQHHTLKELRDLHVVKQQEDYSCGAAALATLMIYYFGENTSEKEILDLLEGRLTEEEKKKKRSAAFHSWISNEWQRRRDFRRRVFN